MMKFQESQPIFMQIFDWLCDKVLRRELSPDQQIPSVREISAELGVNPNTVMRALERLLQQEIIYSRRGMGNYLSADAYDRIVAIRRQRLHDDTLPQLASEITLLGVTPDEVAKILASLQAR